jgi:hypothetical protein
VVCFYAKCELLCVCFCCVWFAKWVTYGFQSSFPPLLLLTHARLAAAV